MKYSASYAKAAREATPIGRTSYVRSDVTSGFQRLKNEIFERAVNGKGDNGDVGSESHGRRFHWLIDRSSTMAGAQGLWTYAKAPKLLRVSNSRNNKACDSLPTKGVPLEVEAEAPSSQSGQRQVAVYARQKP